MKSSGKESWTWLRRSSTSLPSTRWSVDFERPLTTFLISIELWNKTIRSISIPNLGSVRECALISVPVLLQRIKISHSKRRNFVDRQKIRCYARRLLSSWNEYVIVVNDWFTWTEPPQGTAEGEQFFWSKLSKCSEEEWSGEAVEREWWLACLITQIPFHVNTKKHIVPVEN